MFSLISSRVASFAQALFLPLLLAVALPASGTAAEGQPSKSKSDPKTKTQAKAQTADDLLIVDCILPARVRRLGTRGSYITPRRPLRTTAADCRIRGGEYTEPDQANYATSLEAWLPAAKAGDSEAQFYVGQIYEKGLGATPDYSRAAKWYQRSSEQGYVAASVSLAHFYEVGMGVGIDSEKALNLYREAAGASEDLILLAEADYSTLR